MPEIDGRLAIKMSREQLSSRRFGTHEIPGTSVYVSGPLTWAQVDFAGGFVRLEPGTTKNNEGRAFPLIPELRALFERR